ncbi:hypothetical protein JAAARDRAFT_435933 [Jaapia argillacea MUCL 33604]|uniref:Uncharacterized protein n=1 Tax=Jaapia argillacea MUCL 33604 TaxID=933084 RepID=A0A067PE06_9AGAM|nr:hypothetical protein JAAARDRAFT_435933 [Jaapia argillacea MUCL 33604]
MARLLKFHDECARGVCALRRRSPPNHIDNQGCNEPRRKWRCISIVQVHTMARHLDSPPHSYAVPDPTGQGRGKFVISRTALRARQWAIFTLYLLLLCFLHAGRVSSFQRVSFVSAPSQNWMNG